MEVRGRCSFCWHWPNCPPWNHNFHFV